MVVSSMSGRAHRWRWPIRSWRRGTLWCCIGIGGLLASSWGSSAAGDSGAHGQGADEVIDGSTPAERLVQVEAELESIGPDAATEPLRTRWEILDQLRRVLELRELEGQRPPASAGGAALDRWLGDVRHPPPYTLGELDRLLDELAIVEARHDALSAAASAARAAVEDAERASLQRERERRRARDLQASEGGSGDVVLAELESELAAERLRLATEEADASDRELFAMERDLTAFRAELGRVEGELVPSRDELSRIEEEIEAERQEARLRLEADRRALSRAEERWLRESTRSGAGDQSSAESSPSWWAVEQARLEVRFGEERLDRLERRGPVWRHRDALLDPALGATERLALAEAAEVARRDLERQASQVRSQSVALRSAEVQPAVRAALDASLALLDQVSAEIDASLRLEERLARDLARAGASAGLADRLAVWRERLVAAWRFELVVLDDRSVTVGKGVTAVVTFALGCLFAKLFAGWLGRRLLPRLGLDSGAAAAFQTLAFYGLLATFLLMALRLVNIPLTAFTVVGGVLAIGVGFGSQNVVGNFISGLILMAERPIKVGDIVELAATAGRVDQIGARSTRISTSDGTHLIVPNSAILENNVVNWTLSDPVVRGQVTVGVAYGSPTRESAMLIERAMVSFTEVLDDPPPEVRLVDFGDNAIVFRGLFWVRIERPADRQRRESDVRHRIAEELSGAGIVIAFPQRDVHLDAHRPLEIRVLPSETAARERDAGGGRGPATSA